MHKNLDLDPHSSKGLKVRCSLSSFITSTIFLLITFKNSSLSHLRPWLSMCLLKRSLAESSVRKFCNTFSEKSRGASQVVVPVVGNETVLHILVLLSCRRNIESKCSFLPSTALFKGCDEGLKSWIEKFRLSNRSSETDMTSQFRPNERSQESSDIDYFWNVIYSTSLVTWYSWYYP